MSDDRICDTKRLQSMMAAANQRTSFDLDPEGTHVLRILSTDWDGFIKMYLVVAVLKAKDTDRPHIGRMRLCASDYDLLPTASVGF